MNGVIVISVLIAFLISFSTFTVFLNWTSEFDELSQSKKEFYSQNFESSNNIVILGSSQTGRLNSTYIENKISSDIEYEIYNLSIPANRPDHRLSTLEKIIAMDPKLVIYGVGYRDFENTHKPLFNKPTSALPDPKEFFELTFVLNSPLDFDPNLFRYPKVNTLKFIRSIWVEPSSTSELIFDPKMPFYHPQKHPLEPIVGVEGLIEEVSATSWNGIKPYDRNKDVAVLKEIIKKLQDQNVKVIIISVPHNKIFLDATPNEYHEFFDLFIDRIESETNAPSYRLHDAYEQNDIWYDYLHVAIHPDIPIFNDDISEIILKEIER